MNKEELLKKIMELPKIETDNPISAMSGINVDDLMSAVDRLNKVPDYNDLLKENKKLQEELKYTIGIVEHNRIISEKNKETHQLKDNWNKLKEDLINDINDRNGTKIAEFEDGNRVSETISPIYTLMEDKSKTMKEVLDKMQELEQGSDSNE